MEQRKITVAAIMTAPRYECVSARNQIEKAMHTAGIPLTISGGVFYHQCMQTMMENLVDSVDYILTVDFDSVFTPHHVRRLLGIVSQEDSIDAVAAIQPMRGEKRMLGSTAGGGEIEWHGYPIKVNTAHFGLTAIDAKKIKSLPKPWFVSQPDESGSWGDGRVDADVWFWKQWEDAGNTVYIDPGCRLGHLEELVSYYDKEMNLCREYMSKWEELSGSTCD